MKQIGIDLQGGKFKITITYSLANWNSKTAIPAGTFALVSLDGRNVFPQTETSRMIFPGEGTGITYIFEGVRGSGYVYLVYYPHDSGLPETPKLIWVIAPMHIII